MHTPSATHWNCKRQKKSCICRKNDKILEILLTVLYLVTAALCLGATLLDLVLVAAVGAVLFAVADPRVVDAIKLVQALELGRRARRGAATEVRPVVSGSDGTEGFCGVVPGLAPEVTAILICIIIVHGTVIGLTFILRDYMIAFSSDASGQSISPSQRHLLVTQYPSPHENSFSPSHSLAGQSSSSLPSPQSSS